MRHHKSHSRRDELSFQRTINKLKHEFIDFGLVSKFVQQRMRDLVGTRCENNPSVMSSFCSILPSLSGKHWKSPKIDHVNNSARREEELIAFKWKINVSFFSINICNS